ncbi:hypothetical protein Thiosp_03801 [Thiorhodovibrio litoralis]|nr:hypothetical protein Thiosp_03801 [Thiorhodovibrio litoralis]
MPRFFILHNLNVVMIQAVLVGKMRVYRLGVHVGD